MRFALLSVWSFDSLSLSFEDWFFDMNVLLLVSLQPVRPEDRTCECTLR